MLMLYLMEGKPTCAQFLIIFWIDSISRSRSALSPTLLPESLSFPLYPDSTTAVPTHLHHHTSLPQNQLAPSLPVRGAPAQRGQCSPTTQSKNIVPTSVAASRSILFAAIANAAPTNAAPVK